MHTSYSKWEKLVGVLYLQSQAAYVLIYSRLEHGPRFFQDLHSHQCRERCPPTHHLRLLRSPSSCRSTRKVKWSRWTKAFANGGMVDIRAQGYQEGVRRGIRPLASVSYPQSCYLHLPLLTRNQCCRCDKPHVLRFPPISLA